MTSTVYDICHSSLKPLKRTWGYKYAKEEEYMQLKSSTSKVPAFQTPMATDSLAIFRFCTLPRPSTDTGSTVADLVVLHLRDIHQNLRRGVIQLDRLEDRGTVVRHVDVARRRRLQDLVHPLRPERRLHEVAQRERADEGRQARGLGLLFCCLLSRSV